MSIPTTSPFDTDDDLFGDHYFPTHTDSETHDWDSQHQDYDHSHDDLHTFDSDRHDIYFDDDSNHQADDWHTPDPDDAHSFMLGDADNHTAYWVHQNFDPAHPDGIVVGDPGHDMACWHNQSHPDDCAVVAQQSILESLTGQTFSENGLCTEAMVDGCYQPGGGTPVDHVGHVLEEHGIPVEHHYGGTLADLNDRLSHGEKVIVAVNSQELWSPDRGAVLGQFLSQYPGIPGQQADHAVVVTGIVYPSSDPLHPQVVLNDSGTPDGQGMMVPLEQFEQAWASSDHYMVATAVHSSHDAEPDHDSSHPFMLGADQYHHHYHHLVKPKSPYEHDSDSSPNNSSSSDSSSSSEEDYHNDEVFDENSGGNDPSPPCDDRDGDGQCDPSGGDGGDGDSNN